MLDIIFAELVVAAIITFFVREKLAAIIAFFISLLPLLALLDWASNYGFNLINLGIESHLKIYLAGVTLHLAITPLSWFFALMILPLFPVIMLYSYSFFKENDGFFALMLLSLLATFGILLSRDMLSLFLFWEMMSWSSFLLVYRSKDKNAIMSYLIFSVFAAFAILFGIIILWHENSSLLLSDILNISGKLGFVAIASIITGFAVKAVIMPLHAWAPFVYSKCDEPFVAFLSGGLSKLGYYGIFLFLFSLKGVDILQNYMTNVSWNYLLAVFGALSAFFATLIAILQDDLRKLLAYSSIGQLGYIAIGFGIGTPLAITGALFQAFNHAFFKAVLFLAAGIVAYRTGKWKISELGGLAYKMPFTFMATLFAIFALAAIPITSGFASKWLLYEAAIQQKYVFIAPIMLIAGVGAFLYSFRILYGVFLGENRHDSVEEAPKSMIAALFILVLPLIIFVVFPGYMLDLMKPALQAAGIESIAHTKFAIETSLAKYNSIAVLITLMVAMIPALVIYKTRKHRVTSFEDNYLAGEPYELHKPAMHAANNYYKPLKKVLLPYLEPGATYYFEKIYNGIKCVSNAVRRIYTGYVQDYAIYVVLFLLFVMGWLIWI